jgi:cytochrome c-type biogenesis protein CcmH/NrfG
MKLFNQGDFWGAEGAFEWAMRLEPGNAEYLFRRALTLARMPRRGHQAESYFIEAIGLAPSRAEYSLELGNFYAKNALKAKALSVFQNALQRDPGSEQIKAAIKKVGG